MRGSGRGPIVARGGDPQRDDEVRDDRREADLAPGAAYNVAREQMLVAGTEHDEVRAQGTQKPEVRFVRRYLPTALLDPDDPVFAREMLEQAGGIGHCARPDGCAIQQERERGRVSDVTVVIIDRLVVMTESPAVRRKDE